MPKHIVVIPGDGIGTEITDAAVEVLKKIDDKVAAVFAFVISHTMFLAAQDDETGRCPNAAFSYQSLGPPDP